VSQLIRSAPLVKFAEVAALAHVDVPRVFRHVGVDLQCMRVPDLRVPEAWLAGVIDMAERQAGLRSSGLLVALSWRMSDFGRLGLLMQYQPTLRDAFRQFEHYRNLRSEPVTLNIHDAGASAVIQLHLRTERARPGRQTVELALGSLMTLLRTFLGAGWHPQEVRFAHPAPADLRLHHRLFGCPVEFGCDFDGILVDRHDLDSPSPLADACFAEYARELLEQQLQGGMGSNAAHVRRAVELMLPQGRGGIADVGSSLGMSPRTLQRRLEQEGTEFSAVVNEVRRALAIRHMNDPRLPVAQVAALVGFSETSAFSRWFSAQFGQSPSQWRRAARRSP
jgi:AraC-like DNA-binding protein